MKNSSIRCSWYEKTWTSIDKNWEKFIITNWSDSWDGEKIFSQFPWNLFSEEIIYSWFLVVHESLFFSWCIYFSLHGRRNFLLIIMKMNDTDKFCIIIIIIMNQYIYKIFSFLKQSISYQFNRNRNVDHDGNLIISNCIWLIILFMGRRRITGWQFNVADCELLND